VKIWTVILILTSEIQAPIPVNNTKTIDPKEKRRKAASYLYLFLDRAKFICFPLGRRLAVPSPGVFAAALTLILATGTPCNEFVNFAHQIIYCCPV
jgi:hypothetical protein